MGLRPQDCVGFIFLFWFWGKNWTDRHSGRHCVHINMVAFFDHVVSHCFVLTPLWCIFAECTCAELDLTIRRSLYFWLGRVFMWLRHPLTKPELKGLWRGVRFLCPGVVFMCMYVRIYVCDSLVSQHVCMCCALDCLYIGYVCVPLPCMCMNSKCESFMYVNECTQDGGFHEIKQSYLKENRAFTCTYDGLSVNFAGPCHVCPSLNWIRAVSIRAMPCHVCPDLRWFRAVSIRAMLMVWTSEPRVSGSWW